MTMKVVYFVATLFILWIACDASDEPIKCKQGETYEKDCNTCHCTDAGIEVCTARACYNGTQFPDTAVEDHTEIPETNGQVCTPNETKMQDCNRCKCSANGIVWICTRRLCPSPASDVQESNQREKRSHVVEAATTEVSDQKGSDCVPGTRWKNDCNWCWCSDNGFAACTLKGCLGHGQKFHHKFHPGPVVSDNTAHLNKVSDPIRATRDTKVANSRQQIPTIEVSTVPNIEPSSTQKTDRSKLSPERKKYRQAPGSESNLYFYSITPSTSIKPEITPETSTLRDYNTDQYNEAQIKDPKFTCKPSQAFKVECNTCWCNSSGKGIRYCTRIACHPKVYPTLAPPK